ncbi:hypothetical protein FisN_17Lh190 [Fistulifera solaris]|uniref:Uncharacterized protein n=1 Tax=Fistulifera solaris TaxID=1519565 RepID=A0A1Z5JDE3_FISSO|nr:hypothetical protein FisN_17Lh190 [Fistulifera solaris]|eukprot:GAX11902.1 hypothetical protein FisN_17Lh190 [Fistulifera solaris]
MNGLPGTGTLFEKNMHSKLSILLFLLSAYVSVHALAGHNKSRPPLKTDDLKRFSVNGYNDDTFGLVFLGSLFGGQDYVFASTFVGVSAIAAAATNLGYIPSEEARVPGAVAAVNLALSTLLKLTVLKEVATDILPSAVLADVGVSTASVAWSFTKWKISQQNEKN